MRTKTLLPLLALTAAMGSGMAAEKPNIVFILADDLGLGDVSSFATRGKIDTPNIDALVDEGVQFMDAHTSSAVSTPTRYGVLTGRYNWRSTLKQGVLEGYSAPLITRDRSTMATMLGKAGYNTGCIGKWHLGWHWSGIEQGEESVDFSKKIKDGPTTRGFDYFYGFCGSLDMGPYVWVENDMPTAVPTKRTESSHPGFWRDGLTSDDFVHERALADITERSADFILEQSKKDAPYFLYMPIPSPHTPILPSDEFRGKSGLNDYGDYVMRVDHYVGEVVKAIEKSGESENTILVFTADNGCSRAADFNTLEAKGHYPSDIYKGLKTSYYEGGHRVPCVVRYPAQFEPHRIDQTICLNDFYATFAAIVGRKVRDNEAEDSYDITPLLLSSEYRSQIREATVHHSNTGEFAIRKGDWKAIFIMLNRPKGVLDVCPSEKYPLKCELYNLKSDPSEQSDLAEENPAKVEELRKLMISYIEKGRSTPGKPQKNDGVAMGIYLGVNANRL